MIKIQRNGNVLHGNCTNCKWTCLLTELSCYNKALQTHKWECKMLIKCWKWFHLNNHVSLNLFLTVVTPWWTVSRTANCNNMKWHSLDTHWIQKYVYVLMQ
jgi:hypothetical protein